MIRSIFSGNIVHISLPKPSADTGFRLVADIHRSTGYLLMNSKIPMGRANTYGG